MPVSNVVLPINALFKAMAEKIDFTPVYSELDVQSIVTRFRAQALHKNPKDNPKILFGFQRSPLHKYDIIGGRGKWSSPKTGTGNNLTDFYKALYGELNITFAAYFKNMTDLEEFELAMACWGGITEIKRVEVLLPELSAEPFIYPIDWEDLDTIEMPDNDIYKMGLTGNFFIRGFFFVFEGSHKAIKSITAKIAEYEELVFGTDGKPKSPQPAPEGLQPDIVVDDTSALAYHTSHPV